MFDMTAQEQEAFQNATNGVSAHAFNHLILFIIGMLATVWLLLIIAGAWKKVHNQKMDLGEALGMLAFASMIYIAVGSMIFF